MNMKNMKKSLLLMGVMALLTTLLTACSSYDKEYTIYDLWVAGEKVTTRNQADILGDGTVSYVGDGKTGVLTLNGADIPETSDPEAEALIVSTIDHLTINLVGENSLGMGEKTPVNGISAFDLTIVGDGSIAVCARASCMKADTFIVESGTIDTYIKTAEDEVASFIGVGLWAQDLLTINGGDIEVHYLAQFSPLSYGLYCIKDVNVNGGSIRINSDDALFLAVGLISSENLNIAGGDVSVYGFDDAMNAKTYTMTGGMVNAEAVDIYADGVCRLVNKAEFSGGEMTLAALERMNPASITLYSNDLALDDMKVLGGENRDTLAAKDASNYAYTDTWICIVKEGD